MVDKRTAVALVISFIFTGLGIAYLGDVKKGVILFAGAVALNVLGMWVSSIFSYLAIILWAYGLYATYMESQKIN